MRQLTIIMAALIIQVSTSALADETIAPVLEPSPVSHLFVPTGFDDNDNSEVILYGHFPSTCYKTGSVETSIDHDKRLITLKPTSYRHLNQNCGLMRVEFFQTAKLGLLRDGPYRVRVADTQLPTQTIEIKKASNSGPDDYLYAPVREAKIELDWETNTQRLILAGTLPAGDSSCMIIKDVKSIHYKSVFVVLPRAEIVPGPCEKEEFRIEYNILENLKPDTLVHIRVLNGNSLNLIW